MARDSQTAGGHKANLNNPNTSEESKQHSKQVLENEYDGGNSKLQLLVPLCMYTAGQSGRLTSGPQPAAESASDARGKNPGNVAGGLKA